MKKHIREKFSMDYLTKMEEFKQKRREITLSSIRMNDFNKKRKLEVDQNILAHNRKRNLAQRTEQEVLVATIKKIFVIYNCILVCRYSRADCAVTLRLCMNLRLFF